MPTRERGAEQQRNPERGEDREAVPVPDREAQAPDDSDPSRNTARVPKSEGKKRLTSATPTTRDDRDREAVEPAPTRVARRRQDDEKERPRRREAFGRRRRTRARCWASTPPRAPPARRARSGPSRRRAQRPGQPASAPDAGRDPDEDGRPDENAGEVAARDGVAAVVVGEREDRRRDAERGRSSRDVRATNPAYRDRRPRARSQTAAHASRTAELTNLRRPRATAAGGSGPRYHRQMARVRPAIVPALIAGVSLAVFAGPADAESSPPGVWAAAAQYVEMIPTSTGPREAGARGATKPLPKSLAAQLAGAAAPTRGSRDARHLERLGRDRAPRGKRRRTRRRSGRRSAESSRRRTVRRGSSRCRCRRTTASVVARCGGGGRAAAGRRSWWSRFSRAVAALGVRPPPGAAPGPSARGAEAPTPPGRAASSSRREREPATRAAGTSSTSHRASAASPTARRTPDSPAERSSRRVRVARDEVREPGVEQRERRRGVGAPETTVDRGGRQLHEGPGFDRRPQTLRCRLHLGAPFRVRDERA